MLNGQIEQLRNELVRTGAAGGPADRAGDGADPARPARGGAAPADRPGRRADQRRRSASSEDASNRVGDIEFRLTELEGGDTSVKPRAGAARRRRHPAEAAAGGAGRWRRRRDRRRWPSTEQSDFDAAVAAADGRRQRQGGGALRDVPADLSGRAARRPRRSTAAARRWRPPQDWRGAARSFLDAFSGAPQDPRAPHALYQLAVSLGKLGQTDEACLTLTEVDSRYPGSEVAGDVAAQRQALACQ